MRVPLILLALIFAQSCANRRAAGSFRVLPASPDYLLRSPDASETPFPELLSHYNGFVPGKDWLDLRPRMELWIENAYYREGVPKHGLNGFLGTEIARYRVRSQSGLRLLSVQSHLKRRPRDQAPVQQLIQAAQKRRAHYRFFYAVVFKRKGNIRSSVLLGAESMEELERLTTQLAGNPDSVCGGPSIHCTVFPQVCTVSLEMEIVVNGARQTIPWGSLLTNVATRPRHLELSRLYGGRLIPVEIDSADPNALRLPLLPGDQVNWN